MKLTTMLLVITLLQVSAKGYGQITLSEKSVSLEKLMQAIEKQTHYVFIYDSREVKDVMVSIDVQNATIEETLTKGLEKLQLTYRIVNNTVVLTKKEVPVSTQEVIGLKENESIKVTGIITDENKVPLAGVTIRIINKDFGWISDSDGKFAFTLPDETATIYFSYVGYKTKIVEVSASIDLVISLVPDISSLNDVVIIGYGSSTQRELTGSVSKISAATLEKIPATDAILTLEGRLPGVQITTQSGIPGAEVKVQIRGVNSLSRDGAAGVLDRNNNPLYIVDGVPFIDSPLNSQGTSLNMGVFQPSTSSNVYSSPFKSINPADIESIEVLKDADATAIYGARGANGVILITTKKAKPGQTRVELDTYTSFSKVPKFMDLLNTQEYLAMRSEAFRNDGVTPTTNPNDFAFGTFSKKQYAPDLTVWDQNAYTNWQKKYAGETAQTTNAQATVSGGGEQTRFLFSTRYRKQGSVYPGDFGLTQGNFRINLDHNSLDKKFTMTVSSFYSTDLNKILGTDPFSYYTIAPNQPLYNPDGSLYGDTGTNPEAAFRQTYQDRTSNLNGNLILGYKIMDNLRFKVNFGYNKIQMEQVKIIPISSQPFATNPTGIRAEATNSSNTYLIEPQLDYTAKLGEGSLSALLGGTHQQTAANSLFIRGNGYTNDDLLGTLLGGTTLVTLNGTESKYKFLSAFTRLNYNWKGKYIINATGRTDGSSRFGPNKRFGNFGAVGAAWIVTEEPWMKYIPALSFLKLRGSYGITGNDKIPDYQYYSTYQVGNTYQTAGFISNKPFNPDFQWESTTKLEGAIELGFLDDRLRLIANYYRNRTGNSLVSYPLPSQTGFTGVQSNLNAEIENSGFEFDLSTVNVKTSNFSWNTSFNLSLQRNKLLSFPGLDGSPYSSIYEVGKSITNVFGFVYGGVDPATGLSKTVDVNTNGTLQEFGGGGVGDQIVLANLLPSFYGGMNNGFTYKNWQLDVFFNFRKLDNVLYSPNVIPGTLSNIDRQTSDRWQNPGDITNTPKYSATFATGSQINNAYYVNNSDHNLRNGSFARLSNASLNYTLPTAWLKKSKLQSVRLTVSGQNLLVISDFPGVDPETGLSLPALRGFTGGAKITF